MDLEKILGGGGGTTATPYGTCSTIQSRTIYNILNIQERVDSIVPKSFYYTKPIVIGDEMFLLNGYGLTTQGGVYKFNTTTEVFTELTAFPSSLYSTWGDSVRQDYLLYSAVNVIGTDIYIVGGKYYNGPSGANTNIVLKFDTTANGGLGSWTQMNDFPTASIIYAKSVVWNNKLYIFGGNTGSGEADTIYEFNPASGAGSQWTLYDTMPVTLYCSLGLLDGDIFHIYCYSLYMGGGAGCGSYNLSTKTYTAGTTASHASDYYVRTATDQDSYRFGNYILSFSTFDNHMLWTTFSGELADDTTKVVEIERGIGKRTLNQFCRISIPGAVGKNRAYTYHAGTNSLYAFGSTWQKIPVENIPHSAPADGSQYETINIKDLDKTKYSIYQRTDLGVRDVI